MTAHLGLDSPFSKQLNSLADIDTKKCRSEEIRPGAFSIRQFNTIVHVFKNRAWYVYTNLAFRSFK